LTLLERRWALDLLSAFAPEAKHKDSHEDSHKDSCAAPVEARGLSPLPGEVDYLAMFDRMRERATWLAALGLRAALWLVALAPVWQRGQMRSLSRLSSQGRALKLAELLTHRSFVVRELTLLLKLCASMALFAAPGVRARSAYDDVHESPANQSGLRRKGRSLQIVAAGPSAEVEAQPTRTSA